MTQAQDSNSKDSQSSPSSKVEQLISERDLSTPIYGLFTLAILYTLYAASQILLPIVLAILLSLLMAPAVAWAGKRLSMPRALSSLLMIIALLGVISGVLYGVAAPLTEWADEAPEAVENLLESRGEIQADIEELQESAQEIEEEVDSAAEDGDDPVVVIQHDQVWERQFINATQQGVTGLALALALTYFILVSGHTMVRNLAKQMRRSRRRIFLKIVLTGQSQVAKYLGVITLTNVTIGVIIGLTSWAVGLPTPVLWGLVATLARFIPYIGGILGAGLLFVVSYATFDDMWQILLIPGLFFVLASIVGFFLEPYIHGERLAVNPIIIFISIFFWGWLWGPVGVFLAVPLMTIVMVVVSHIPKLEPLSNVLHKDQKRVS